MQDKPVLKENASRKCFFDQTKPFWACGDVGRAHDFQKKVCVEICVICGYKKEMKNGNGYE